MIMLTRSSGDALYWCNLLSRFIVSIKFEKRKYNYLVPKFISKSQRDEIVRDQVCDQRDTVLNSMQRN